MKFHKAITAGFTVSASTVIACAEIIIDTLATMQGVAGIVMLQAILL